MNWRVNLSLVVFSRTLILSFGVQFDSCLHFLDGRFEVRDFGSIGIQLVPHFAILSPTRALLIVRVGPRV